MRASTRFLVRYWEAMYLRAAHLLIPVADDQCVEPALSVAAGDSHYLAASPWS